jgi:hypothetical protein
MSRKYSEARRAAFIRALAETGNQTLAAERAKVSRSWVQLHRSTDPAFDAGVRAALRQAQDGLAKAKERKPASGWGYLHGEELVVKGTGGRPLDCARDERKGRRIQIARARVKQWTPRVEQRFLAALLATCNVTASCAAVGMTPASAYAHRKRWEKFAALWDEAIAEGYLNLEVALIQNAQNLFSAEELPPPETALGGMDAAQAIPPAAHAQTWRARAGQGAGQKLAAAADAGGIAAGDPAQALGLRGDAGAEGGAGGPDGGFRLSSALATQRKRAPRGWRGPSGLTALEGHAAMGRAN